MIGIALSGGRDSLLTLLVAHRYASRARPENPGALLHAFYMPSRYSSDETRAAAETICPGAGRAVRGGAHRGGLRAGAGRTRSDARRGRGMSPSSPKQNIQARIRAQRMWNWSNSSGGLFLQTGNMSEKAVGYTTIGGDLEGALGVIANVPKTVVMDLLDYLLEKTGYEGIRQVLAKPAGPELAPNQVGEDGADALPGAGRVLPPLRRARSCCPQEVELVLAAMFPEYPAEQIRAWVEKFARLFLHPSTSGCRRRSRCTSATWTSTASARCSCPWCRTGVGCAGGEAEPRPLRVPRQSCETQ